MTNLTKQQQRVLQDLLVDAKRKHWLTKTGRATPVPATLAKHAERVAVLKALLEAPEGSDGQYFAALGPRGK
jgi:hypothetical protein